MGKTDMVVRRDLSPKKKQTPIPPTNPRKNKQIWRKERDKKMCKTMEIKYRCDRCGNTITKTRQIHGPIQYTGFWPRTYKRLHQKHVCTKCYNDFYQQTLPQFFANQETNTTTQKQKKTMKRDLVAIQ